MSFLTTKNSSYLENKQAENALNINGGYLQLGGDPGDFYFPICSQFPMMSQFNLQSVKNLFK